VAVILHAPHPEAMIAGPDFGVPGADVLPTAGPVGDHVDHGPGIGTIVTRPCVAVALAWSCPSQRREAGAHPVATEHSPKAEELILLAVPLLVILTFSLAALLSAGCIPFGQPHPLRFGTCSMLEYNIGKQSRSRFSLQP
jgi:hypothetical protein